MPRPALIFAVFLAPYFLSYFFRSTNAVIADDLVREVGLGPEQLGLMTGFYFIAFALAQLPIGPALDRFGSRRTIAALLLFTAAGSLVFGLATSFGGLALGRALIGLGVASVLVGSLKAFAAWFPPERFATVSGIFVSLGASGALLATTPLVALKAVVGWRAVFLGGAGLALLAALLLIAFARDAPGAVRSAAPSVPQGRVRDVLGERRFWQVAFLNFAMVGSFFAYQSLWMGPYLAGGQALDDLTVGNLLFVLALASVLGYFGSGWLADRFGLLRVITVSAGLFFGSQLVLAALPAASVATLPAASVSALLLIMVVFGVTGAFNVMLFSHVRQLFPAYLTGRALALNNFFGMSGVAVMQWFLGAMLGWGSGFAALFWVTGLLGLLSVFLYAPLLKGVR
jgi:MFS family permease